jgi:hypothetical protein
LLEYGRRESYFSDHRPVFGTFYMKVCEINREKKQELERKELDRIFSKSQNNDKHNDMYTMVNKGGKKNNDVSDQNNKSLIQEFNFEEVYIDGGNTKGKDR